MLALAPVYAAIAAAVVLESGTPVLFRQPRIGRNGRHYVRQNYRWDVIIGKYERMFMKLRQGGARR